MPVEFWFSICSTFVGVALSFFTYITKKEKTGAIIATVISFLIAIISFIFGIKDVNESKNPEQFSNQLASTISIQKSTYNNTYNNVVDNKNIMFTNYFETHNPEGISSYISMWNSNSDRDIRGSYHEYENGLKLSIYKGLYLNSNILTSDLHLIYNKNYSGNTHFSGYIILSDNSSGTKSSADVSILIDGHEVWKTDNKITGITVTPIQFNIDLKDCKEEVIIRTNCYLQDSSFEFGIF